MTPTDICVSLETAQALAEAGWEKETVFSYYIALDGEDPFLRQTVNSILEYFPAPTLGELFDSVNPGELIFEYEGESTLYHSWLTDNVGAPLEIRASSHQDALAQLWINHPEIRKS